MEDANETTDKPPHKYLPLRNLVPNLLTVLAICAGLSSIRFAIEARFELAAAMIIIAAILDGLDGRVARYLKGTSKLGAELDSLADFANFGVAPGILLYIWVLRDVRGFGWVIVMAYVICCGLRLARFNVMSRETEQVKTNDPRFFVGVPAPAAAGLALLPLFASLAGWVDMRQSGGIIALYLAGVGFLMVSRIPTFSFKRILIPRDQIILVLIGAVVLTGTVITFPWESMVVLDLIYVGTIFRAIIVSRKKNLYP